jgi:hypothetical protein
MECGTCGSDDIVLDSRQGYTVCNNCGTIIDERVVAEDYESNRDYNGEHFALPVAENATFDIRTVDGRLKDIEIKSERFKFLKDWIVRLQQPDVHEFPNDVLACADAYIDDLHRMNYLRLKKDIALMHILAAALFLAHETCNNPVSTLHIKTAFGLITVVPVSQQIQILRLLLKLQQPDSEPVEVFKHKLMKSLVKMNDIKSVCSNSKTMREIFNKIDKMMMIWEALSADRQITLLMKLQSNPLPCIYLFNHFQRPVIKQTCRKACTGIYECLVRLEFDFSSLKL